MWAALGLGQRNSSTHIGGRSTERCIPVRVLRKGDGVFNPEQDIYIDFHCQGAGTIKEEEEEGIHELEAGRHAVKSFLLNMTRLTISWTHSNCGHLHKIKPAKIQHRRER